MAAMYAVYHGPKGLKHIANKVHLLTKVLKEELEAAGFEILNASFFDTLTVRVADASNVHQKATEHLINLRRIDATHVGITLDESVGLSDLRDIINIFRGSASLELMSASSFRPPFGSAIPSCLVRHTTFLSHPVFNSHHSETQMLRYIHHLQSKDLSLVHSMIPLGSCTMKLNSTSSMIPLTWPEFSTMHPFVPVEQAIGYGEIIKVGIVHS